MLKKRKKSYFKLINLYKFQLKYRLFAFFVIVLFLIFLYIRFIAIPIVVTNTESQMQSYATKSINYAIAESMNQNVSYGDLINIIRDSNDKVSYIEANTVRINLLSKTMTRNVVANFLEFSKMPIAVSLGAFSGIAIFAGMGPKIAIEVNPYSEVNCYFTSNFKSAGINQTYHKLYLIIAMKVTIVFPFKQLVVNSNAEVLLSESLIVGEIPEVYLNSNKLNDMLNLVPNRFSS